MEIIRIKSSDFKKYGEALVNLYLATFSEGESFQYHTREDTESYLQSIFKNGYGIIAIEDHDLLGAILMIPLHFDDLVPDVITQNFNLSHSIYVTEMMVEKSKQGCGIGKKLLLQFLETVDRKNYQHAFIRVWIENVAAVGLYKKMGFTECATIEQAKLLADKSAVFNFKKSYLHQKLT